jgi:cell division protein YceG involved in septum cleavage
VVQPDYFVVQPDGKHVFSESYADHLAAIRRARRRR